MISTKRRYSTESDVSKERLGHIKYQSQYVTQEKLVFFFLSFEFLCFLEDRPSSHVSWFKNRWSNFWYSAYLWHEKVSPRREMQKRFFLEVINISFPA